MQTPNSLAKAARAIISLVEPQPGTITIAGFVCFDVDGMTPSAVIAALHDRGILAGATPYPVSYARVTPGLLNSEAEVETTLEAVRASSAPSADWFWTVRVQGTLVVEASRMKAGYPTSSDVGVLANERAAPL